MSNADLLRYVISQSALLSVASIDRINLHKDIEAIKTGSGVYNWCEIPLIISLDAKSVEDAVLPQLTVSRQQVILDLIPKIEAALIGEPDETNDGWYTGEEFPIDKSIIFAHYRYVGSRMMLYTDDWKPTEHHIGGLDFIGQFRSYPTIQIRHDTAVLVNIDTVKMYNPKLSVKVNYSADRDAYYTKFTFSGYLGCGHIARLDLS